ncbi:VOC family protein [uncultured Microbacterium sp.]|uniref:VOC family protein n=1 Tax=uncultured Microbacterium sp. TaxID=191216 RepID=UPI0026267B23|nr:VOC family protein [uncultured Microbacterium sp.]
MSQKIVPNIWCTRNADEAGEFYADALPRTTAETSARYPMELPDWQAEFAGRTLTVDVSIDGFQITLINAGDEFSPNPSMSFMLNFDPLMFDGSADDARAALDETWARLAEGGRIIMALDAYPFSPHYGWVEDRFGVSWQLLLTNPEGEPRPFVIPQLMFCGPVQNRSREAASFYSGVLPGSGVGFIAEHRVQTGPAEPGTVMFGEFRLAGQWFSMMDSAIALDYTFTPGISLEVRCADQAEIDEYWDALSAVPEAEQCGWLTDRYGLSWQIVPETMGALMERPGAYEKMMEMKKLVIADF